MAAASEPGPWYLILQSTLIALFGQLLRTAGKAFRSKTMTNVKKERGNLEFKRLLSDRQVRSKADIYQVFIIVMLIEVNHSRAQGWMPIQLQSIYKCVCICIYVCSYIKYIHIHKHSHICMHSLPDGHSSNHHHPFWFSLGC